MDINLLLVFGVVLLLGIFTARVMDRISTPHVVGFILLGVFLGDSFLGLISAENVGSLGLIVDLALGFIGFSMGEHLHRRELLKLGRSIVVISILESLGAFCLTFFGVYLVSRTFYLSLIFAALSAATAPAATVDVLKQYKAKGPLTTTLLAVIGIDDAIALFLYSISIPFVFASLSSQTVSGLSMVWPAMVEIIGAVLLGFIFAFPVDYFIDRMEDREEILLFIIGSVFLVIGLALYFRLSVILATLVFGTITINLKHSHAVYVSGTIDRVGPILYILFFVLVGARLQLALLPKIGLIGISYIVFRAAGKIWGAFFGAKLAGAEDSVRKYLGLSLLSQAGVAVGLALSLSGRLAGSNSNLTSEWVNTIVTTIIATTLVIQIIGPILTRKAIFASGEARDRKGSFFG